MEVGERAPTCGSSASATAERKGGAATVETTWTGPAHQGRERGEGKCGRAGRLGRPTGPKGGRGKENEFSFSNLIFQIHFPKFLKLF
jgi:hypothetical protein